MAWKQISTLYSNDSDREGKARVVDIGKSGSNGDFKHITIISHRTSSLNHKT